VVDARGAVTVDERLEAAILHLLASRADDATICPSEAARAVAAEADGSSARDPSTGAGAPDDGWRELMEPARRAAGRLAAAGEVEVTQGGQVVDVSTARGPVRIRRVRG
jgi:hypothetical protein